MGLGKEPREEVAAPGLVDQVRVPPAEPAGRAAPLARPRDGELEREDRVEGGVDDGSLLHIHWHTPKSRGWGLGSRSAAMLAQHIWAGLPEA